MKPEKTEKVLLRNNSTTSNLLSSFGVGIKETRLTSYLGYLISLNISELNALFSITSPIEYISLEKHLKTQRCDIVVQTINSLILIEAKRDNFDTTPQLLKQSSEFITDRKITKISLTKNKHKYKNDIKSVSWQNVYDTLSNAKFESQKHSILCNELLKHLEETHMVKTDRKEIYGKDMNKEPYVSLFLKAHVYFCKANDHIYDCSYFAPYFGNKISTFSPAIKEGMGYIAKINNHIECNSLEEIIQSIKSHIKKEKIKIDKEDFAQLIKMLNESKDTFNNDTHLLLQLGKPRLLFNPPIPKDKLQDGAGWLSKNYFSFDDLFEAANL